MGPEEAVACAWSGLATGCPWTPLGRFGGDVGADEGVATNGIADSGAVAGGGLSGMVAMSRRFENDFIDQPRINGCLSELDDGIG